MGPFEAQVITTVVAVSGALLGVFLITNFWLKKKELERREDPKALEVLQDLRHELSETRAELAEVQERVDFAERLLTEGRKKEG